ncbi:hypothetical protein UFOVP46_21 [uncultured Caudovirales phage]|uniref:Uncharacterized protein n=1 Tax=uncultured Caudovirales phage TaxID=2100421 RepID=A0A6J5KTG0_9CAUD|nr:hypothetical protein UFOVP46_21 [uncultured Caudovirales phage]
MKKLLTAIQKAAADTASFVEHDIRRSALAHGWDKDVVANTHVSYEGGDFKVHTSPEHASRAFVHEYGNEATRPTAVIRKYNNNPGKASEAFVTHLQHHMRGK